MSENESPTSKRPQVAPQSAAPLAPAKPSPKGDDHPTESAQDAKRVQIGPTDV
ncbi:MAG: hypothetical protein WC247_00815 [Porticoccaceae bacterium]|jgi:hypothetical protein